MIYTVKYHIEFMCAPYVSMAYGW